MSELIDREALKDAVKRYAGEPIKEKDRKCQAICLDMLGTIDSQPAASPWHRVEEELPPKATWVLTVATDGNVKIFNIATVDAGGQWWTCSPQKILRELYVVRYWMPIEPPKEDA